MHSRGARADTANDDMAGSKAAGGKATAAGSGTGALKARAKPKPGGAKGGVKKPRAAKPKKKPAAKRSRK
jgi:hypothetical protein